MKFSLFTKNAFAALGFRAMLLRNALLLLILAIAVSVLGQINRKNADRIHEERIQIRKNVLAAASLGTLHNELATYAPLLPAIERLVPAVTDSTDIQEAILRAATGSLGLSPKLTFGGSFPTQAEPDVTAVTFSLSGAASYDSVGQFLQGIEKLPFLIRITGISFTLNPVEKNETVNVSGEFYVHPIQ